PTNDPWLATGHLPDFTLATPVFYEGRLVAFTGSIAHSLDVGGRLWGADAREVFEEGLRLPPVKLLREGEPDESIFDLIRANVRVPNEVIGDLQAQVAANSLAARK